MEEPLKVEESAIENTTKRKKMTKLSIPRRKPSVAIQPRQIIYPTPDKYACSECPCFPKDSPYRKPVKLTICLMTPPTLYELTALVVDRLGFPEAFHWTVEMVAQWMEEALGLPEYKGCIEVNKIDGRRLLLLESASHLPPIGVRSLEHIQMITSKVRELFSTEFIKFSRSIGLPLRKPLTHCTIFKSRTGPTWGIRQNWTRCDLLRAMEIIMPAPIHRNHWDLVWYHKPDFPKVKFGRIPKRDAVDQIPHYKEPRTETSNEILVPRKFILNKNIPKENQMIWIQKIDYPPINETDEDHQEKPKKPKKSRKPSRLEPKPVSCEGLKGKALILARRKRNKSKFFPQIINTSNQTGV